ncbi:heme A synthase [Hahella sp. HN01]|uniref:COX15/CtaA family protein n=1 Tax=Hahella sp. HN01 TaxID=2847262 RepID=UPI001C1EB616|nr:COX15/CtaA family protein [Hahella sp. HN01]MBU6950224.1 COX15/CtaA family protein [Hahella sp. HN01]
MDYVAPPALVTSAVVNPRLQWLRRLVILTTVWAFCVILLGAYTRLMDAGLGCPDWPGCYGFLTVPNEAHEIEIAEARFPHAPVEVHKGWPEMVHRYFASGLGLLIFAIAALSWRDVSPNSVPGARRPPRKLTLFLCALVILQGLFGMWTVTLKLWPQVVSAHLLGGFCTLTLLALTAMRLLDRLLTVSAETLRRWRRLRPLALLAVALLATQIFLGAWVTSNYAAVACPDFPTCQEKLWPEMDFQHGFNLTQTIGPNYLGGLMHNEARVAIHMTHRLGAVAVLLVLGGFLIAAWRRSQGSPLRRSLGLTGALLLLQIALGVTNVVALVPLPVAVAHNGVAALLLISLVWVTYRLWTAKEVRS